ncbi:hypothetical protein DN820_16735 [Stutzerimonas nosocomialis]|uniref:Uncharacterized protein n=1 Tax=Stutzerimonas nosocomialis TaxID=1056496 RepID=A0A5R9QB21_9GAMM|nr:hypothetical protein DN820_16735 [Stutzerimonas nosocomialis]
MDDALFIHLAVETVDRWSVIHPTELCGALFGRDSAHGLRQLRRVDGALFIHLAVETVDR